MRGLGTVDELALLCSGIVVVFCFVFSSNDTILPSSPDSSAPAPKVASPRNLIRASFPPGNQEDAETSTLLERTLKLLRRISARLSLPASPSPALVLCVRWCPVLVLSNPFLGSLLRL